MTVWVGQLADELIVDGDADTLLHVTGCVRLLGHAYHGAHIHPGGTLITSGIVREWLRIDTGGTFYSSGLVRTQSQLVPAGCSTSEARSPCPASRTNCPARSSSLSAPVTGAKCSAPPPEQP